MISIVIRQVAIFLGLLLLQAAVIDDINLGRIATPYMYIMSLLILPLGIAPWLQLVLAFAGGLSLDFFSNTGGMHAFSMVLAAYIRPYVLQLFINKDTVADSFEPNLPNMGFKNFFFYALSIIFVYHFSVTMLDHGTLHYFFRAMSIVIISTLLTLLIVFLLQLLFYRIKIQ